MARTVKDAKLETREARSKLEARGKPRWREIGQDLDVGYRRLRGTRDGTFVARRHVKGKLSAKGVKQPYETERLGAADDYSDSDGVSVLSFWQAQEKAREWHANRGHAMQGGPLTVRQACESYVMFLRAHKKTGDDADGRLKKHFLPTLADRPVAELTKEEIEKCHWAMVRRNHNPEIERQSKDSANRVLSSFKAALNRAFDEPKNKIPSDLAWRRVKPFEAVGRARQVHLDAAQSNRLINVCGGAFRRLVTAALLTGARAPHELASLRVRDFHAELGTLSVLAGKTGPRDIVLTREAVGWFHGISAGRAPDELLLPRDAGTAWNKSEHTRDMIEAVKRAKLPKGCTLYSLRHTYASQSLLAGMNIKLLAENMGTSVRMLELHYAKFIAASRRELVEKSTFRLGLKPSNNVTAL
jgi:integrase